MKKKDSRLADTDGDLITLSEAAQLRNKSVSAISHLVRRGRLRSVEQFGKNLVYRSEVLSFEPEKGGRPSKLASTGKAATAKARAGNGTSPGKKRGKK